MPPVDVRLETVAVAVPGGVTEAGLTTHVGGVAPGGDVTPQVRSTLLLKPFSGLRVMFDSALPPGFIANGEKAPIWRLKSCADAVMGPSMRPKRKTAAIPRVDFNANRADDDSDFSMSREYFKFFDSGSHPKAARQSNYLKLIGAVLHTNIFVPSGFVVP